MSNRSAADVTALLRQVNELYATGGAPARPAPWRRAALAADERHRLALAAITDLTRGRHRSYLAALVECRADTPHGLRLLLRLVAANAVATVLHWALTAPGPDGEERWTAHDVLAAARADVPPPGAVPSGALRWLAAIDPNIELAAGVPPAPDGPLRSHDEVSCLLGAVEAVYCQAPSGGGAWRGWEADELHALVLDALLDAEREGGDGAYLETLVAWGVDTPEGLHDLLRLQAAAAARGALRWLLADGAGSTPWREEMVLAEATVSPWWMAS